MRSPHNESQLGNDTKGIMTAEWIAIALSMAVLVAAILEQFIHNQPSYTDSFSPTWIPFVAVVFVTCGIIPSKNRPMLLRINPVMRWGGLFLMLWTANGIPFDLLRLTPLIPLEVDWPGLVTRTLALAEVIVLARLVFTLPATPPSTNSASWYGYVAFVLALPYPVVRTFWAFGSTIGLKEAGGGGEGFAPLLIAIPWVLAAILSLLLVSKRQWMSRRNLLVAGWTATGIVATIAPAAFWSMLTTILKGSDIDPGPTKIATWVFCLFYSSWFFWAIAAGAATRSYQLRTGKN